MLTEFTSKYVMNTSAFFDTLLSEVKNILILYEYVMIAKKIRLGIGKEI